MAWWPVGAAVAACVTVLAATTTRYGYHRDELYFLLLRPAWGYVDQPPLTPLLARASTALFGDALWAIRVPATLSVAVAIVLIALTTREVGGGRAAQALAAWGFAFAAFPLVVGHLLVTATVDLAVWAAVLLFVVRALLRDQPRWWLAAGAVVGLGLYNKLLIVLLLIALAVGLLAMGPRTVLRSPWLWGGVAVALVLGAPNLVYQVTHDLPQVRMAAALEDNNGDETRVLIWPFQLILLGLPLVPIWVAGFVALLRRPAWRPLRALAIAYPVVLLINFASGGQVYYASGIMALLFAVGCVPTVDWMTRGRASARRRVVVTAVAVNAAFTLLLSLPLLPVTVVGSTPIPAINQGMRDEIGWPEYVAQVAEVYRGLSAADQAHAVIVTGNYGEAGAVTRFGPEFGLPTVYSGHNQLYFYGPPPPTATVAIVWGIGTNGVRGRFTECEQRATLDNGVDVENEEQGSSVLVCRGPVGGWAAVWPRFQHYD